MATILPILAILWFSFGFCHNLNTSAVIQVQDLNVRYVIILSINLQVEDGSIVLTFQEFSIPSCRYDYVRGRYYISMIRYFVFVNYPIYNLVLETDNSDTELHKVCGDDILHKLTIKKMTPAYITVSCICK